MNRVTPILLAPVLSFFCFTAGCGGGPSGSIIPPPQNPVPAISSVNPTSVVAGSSNIPVDVTGSNFISTSVIAWNGAALTTTFVSATELKATLPATDLAGSSTSQITVQNPAPGGGTSTATTFTVNSPVPAITAISPRYVPPGAAATITITGTGFESNSSALWNTSPRPTTFVSATTLTVALSATDLQNQGTGALTVSNPAPSASSSSSAPLLVTSQPVPVIQSATVSTASTLSFPAMCPQLEVTLIGTNFALDSTVQANGVSLTAAGEGFAGGMGELVAYFPAGFLSTPGALSFTVTNPDGGPIVSNPFPYPSASPTALALCATPSPATVYAPSSFSIVVLPSEVNISGSGTLSLGTLPAGITWANTSVALPPAGVTLHLQAANNTVAGPYDIVLNGAVSGANTQGNFNFTVSAGTPPSFFFTPLLHDEVGVPIGGSGSVQFSTIANPPAGADFDITPSITGLPPGTTATFSPNTFSVGQGVTVTLNAASNAPVTQNAPVTLTGTPSAQVADATASFFADVTQPPGSLPGNRSDFVSTAGTPYAAVYDSTHNLIFASNPSWNRVDVISNVTHKIVKSIPVRAPRGLDITQDNSTVWVQTAGVAVSAINTVSLQANQYSLPNGPVAAYGLPVSINTSGDRILALSDGTLFVYFNDAGGEVGASAGVWNPQTNQMTVLVSGIVTGLGFPVRSGDGTLVYAPGSASFASTGMSIYSVSSKTLATINSGTGYNPIMAVNHDGSRLVLGFENSASLYDQNLTLLGTVPGTLEPTGSFINGGILFSADGTKLYELADDHVAGILTIDAASLAVLGIAPAAVISPVDTSGADSLGVPFGIDTSGIVLGRQNFGISFDDSTFVQNYAANQPAVSGALAINAIYAGPLSGGTVSSLFLFPDLIPDVWFGQTRGAAAIAGAGLNVTSPPSTVPGPVNVKLIFPDGEQVFAPQLFSYSTFPEYAVISGSGPNGGAPGQILGYGLPVNPTGGTLTIGSNPAAITPPAGGFIPFSAEPFPSTTLSYTFPAGSPGFADLTVSTPIGTGTLPKSIYYAKSVTDYPSTDTFTAVLFDAERNQVYLSAGNHIDVFSTTSNQFVAPLTPVAKGAQKQFAGLALTPDGSQLLAADLTDGSLAVIDPDSGSSSYIFIATAGPGINSCEVGPLYVGATSTTTNEAFVSLGSLPAPSCPQSGPLYLVNLSAKTAAPTAQCTSAQSVDASADGNYVGFGSPPCIYSVQNSTYTLEPFPYGSTNEFGIAISGDANVVAANQILGTVNGNMLGSVAQPIALYGSPNSLDPPILLPRPRLNASGSLYYSAFQNYFEIVDVAHALLRMRFSLTEVLQSVAAPIAIDSGGRFIYLITNQGLTVVDLGAAPLSIGHLSPQNAAPGTQVTVRGSGFDSTVTATVGGVTASVTVTDQNTLTLTVPSASSGPQDIILTRGDGETYTLENAIVLP